MKTTSEVHAFNDWIFHIRSIASIRAEIVLLEIKANEGVHRMQGANRIVRLQMFETVK